MRCESYSFAPDLGRAGAASIQVPFAGRGEQDQQEAEADLETDTAII